MKLNSNTTLADIRRATRVILPAENTNTVFKAGGLESVTKDFANTCSLQDITRVFARQERANITRQIRTDVVVTGGVTKSLDNALDLKTDLDVCGEWAPWSKVFQLQNK